MHVSGESDITMIYGKFRLAISKYSNKAISKSDRTAIATSVKKHFS